MITEDPAYDGWYDMVHSAPYIWESKAKEAHEDWKMAKGMKLSTPKVSRHSFHD